MALKSDEAAQKIRSQLEGLSSGQEPLQRIWTSTALRMLDLADLARAATANPTQQKLVWPGFLARIFLFRVRTIRIRVLLRLFPGVHSPSARRGCFLGQLRGSQVVGRTDQEERTTLTRRRGSCSRKSEKELAAKATAAVPVAVDPGLASRHQYKIPIPSFPAQQKRQASRQITRPIPSRSHDLRDYLFWSTSRRSFYVGAVGPSVSPVMSTAPAQAPRTIVF